MHPSNDSHIQLIKTINNNTNRTGTRSASAVLAGVRPVPASVPTGTITRVCTANPCPPTHAGGTPLLLSLRMAGASSDATVAWSLNGAAISGATSARVTIPAASLPTNGAPAVVTATITKGDATGVASLTVPINVAPRCVAPAGYEGDYACLTVATGKAGDAFPAAEFAATAAGIVDDAPASELTYEWGVMVNKVATPMLIDRANAFTFRGLPQGESTVYVRAVDAQGASVVATAKVTVVAPAEGFSAAAAAAAVDVDQAVATKDPAAVGAAARTLAALFSVGGAAVQDAVDTKGPALLTSSAASINQWDPEGAVTTAASAAKLVAVMKNVSLETRETAVQIGDKRE
jgi:hypothetical protein